MKEFCWNCGQEIAEGADYCSHCRASRKAPAKGLVGSAKRKESCGNCGKPLERIEAYCPNCGQKMERDGRALGQIPLRPPAWQLIVGAIAALFGTVAAWISVVILMGGIMTIAPEWLLLLMSLAAPLAGLAAGVYVFRAVVPPLKATVSFFAMVGWLFLAVLAGGLGSCAVLLAGMGLDGNSSAAGVVMVVLMIVSAFGIPVLVLWGLASKRVN